MKKAEVKLKDEIYDFYSKLIQHLTDRVRLEILSVIETKEEWMDENLKDYRQLLDQKNEAAEDNEPLNKKLIEQQRENLRRLNQELGDIRRMQRI
jgi:ClpP class serine protease